MLRDVGSDTQRFQGAMDRLSMLLAIEMTREIRLEESPLQTPLAITAGFTIKDRIGVVPILRAGLALVGAFRGLIPGSTVLHLGMYRDEETARPVAYYNKLEDAPEVDVAFIVDPMLATGGSAIAAIDALVKKGVSKIVFGCVIAAPEGISAIREQFPNVSIFACSIDEGLNDSNYIVPGLGDAGDRYFGTVL